MPRSEMLASVTQAFVLRVLGDIASYHLTDYAFASVEEQSAALFGGPSNSTQSSMDPASSSTSFWFSKLPRRMGPLIILLPILYYWNIWLERRFPGRARNSDRTPAPASGATKVDCDEQVEEEIIKKWVAQGKIKRSSISWGNTFIKWLLDLSIGLLTVASIQIVLEALMDFRGLDSMSRDFRMILFGRLLPVWISSTPFVAFIAFAIIPAHKRIVFEAGMDLLWYLFFGSVLVVFLPWIMKQDWMQEALKQHGNGTLGAGNTTLLGDEL